MRQAVRGQGLVVVLLFAVLLPGVLLPVVLLLAVLAVRGQGGGERAVWSSVPHAAARCDKVQ